MPLTCLPLPSSTKLPEYENISLTSTPPTVWGKSLFAVYSPLFSALVGAVPASEGSTSVSSALRPSRRFSVVPSGIYTVFFGLKTPVLKSITVKTAAAATAAAAIAMIFFFISILNFH